MADISSDKIRELLSDPKNIELIAGLAGSMGRGGLLGTLVGKSENTEPALPAVSQPEPDISAGQSLDIPDKANQNLPDIPVMSNGFDSLPPKLPQSISSDKRIALLKAIKPYISDSKKERVDGLVRAISVAGILNNYKGGLFG